ncbi:MAG: SDR family NAD(P)-dependent oxidoreductase, partial [Kibdelosporangium sp.]
GERMDLTQRLKDRVAIITGGASGIGLATARALAGANAEVTLAVRDPDVRPGVGKIEHLDLADQASVRKFVANWAGPLHILVNNAGIMAPPLMRTAEGWEMQFATNHLGHFALATGLYGALKAAGNARVVSVSSVGHITGGIDFDDIHFERRPYDPWSAYSQSKTANILFAVEAARRWAAAGVTVNALTPGRIRTNLIRYVSDEAGKIASDLKPDEVPWKTPEQGAATSVLLAASPLVTGVTGRYYEDCQQAQPVQPGIRRGVAPYALDLGAANRLWDVSLAALGA